MLAGLAHAENTVSLELLGQKLSNSSDDEIFAQNMRNFFEGLSNGGANPLAPLVQSFYTVDNDTIKLVLRSLEQSMNEEVGRMLKKPQPQVIADSVRAARNGQNYRNAPSVKGLSSYSKQQSDALLTFIEIFYRNRDKPNLHVQDFLFIFRESGLPFLNKLRGGLGLPGFKVDFCSQIIGKEACIVK